MAAAGMPVIRTVRMAYHDVWRAVRAMPHLALITAVIVFALNLVQYTAVPKSVRDFPAVAFVSILVTNLVVTPLAIAIFRFILADETTREYAIALKEPRFVRFFAWSVALSSLWLIPTIIDYVTSIDDPVSWVAWAVALLVYFIAMLRLVILFPAIALDAPGATVANSVADTKGHVLNILFIYLVALLTLSVAVVLWLVLVVVLSMVTPGAITEGDPPGWALAAIIAVAELAFTSLLVGIDARIFQALADRVLRLST